MPSSSQRKTSRPTTPLRRIERGSLSALSQSRSGAEDSFPLDTLDVAFAELSDAFSDFSANMQQIVELGQGISRFNESFASFLYGLNVNAFCVDFAEVRCLVSVHYANVLTCKAPITESFKRHAERRTTWRQEYNREVVSSSNHDQTFLTTDDSFVERPPPRRSAEGSSRGGAPRGRGRGGRRVNT